MRVLIAYATTTGSTAEVAAEIARAIESEGCGQVLVDVRRVEEVEDVDEYDAVIAGSAVRMRRWLPAGVRFVQRYRTTLAGLPVAFFQVCLTMREATDENCRRARGYVDWITRRVPEVRPRTVGLFAGAFDPAALGFPLGPIMPVAKVPAPDHRDWAAVRAWAHQAFEAIVRPQLALAPNRGERDP